MMSASHAMICSFETAAYPVLVVVFTTEAAFFA
jgi:hypothetical protein